MRQTIHFFFMYMSMMISAHAGALVEIAVADHQRAQDAWAIATAVLMTGAQGDVVTLVDAGSVQRKATLNVTNEMAASPNQNARSVWLTKQQAGEFANAKAFLLNTSSTNHRSSNFLRWLRSLELRRMEFQKVTRFDAIYLGSPLVTEPEAYSMVNRYPSDAFLWKADSLFEVDKSKSPLKGIAVHAVHSVGLLEFSERNRDYHREKIKRFYGLFIDGLGGNLATFAGNIDHLRSMATATFPRVDYGEPNRAEKPVIYEVITPALKAMDDERQNSLWANKIGANPPPPKDTSSPVDIGITWNRNIDLDLYVKPVGDQELSFKQTVSTTYRGRFLRDITSLPGTNGFETITYDSAVPLRTIQVHVNHYAGSAVAPIEIELRVRTNGQTYFRKFSLPPGTGTRGGGAREGVSWIKIPLQQVLGFS